MIFYDYATSEVTLALLDALLALSLNLVFDSSSRLQYGGKKKYVSSKFLSSNIISILAVLEAKNLEASINRFSLVLRKLSIFTWGGIYPLFMAALTAYIALSCKL